MGRLALIAGDAHPGLGREIARLAGASIVAASIEAFADGETRIRIQEPVQGADLYIVQPTSAPVNERLMTLGLIADAARAEGAERITALVPYFGYGRQDVRGRGEPRSARLAARILSAAGVQRLATLDLHSAALENAFDMTVMHLSTAELFVPVVRAWQLERAVVVSPDAGGLKRAQRLAAALRAPLAAIVKTRPEADRSAASQVLGEVRGRPCIIVDDIASTGGTIANAARALREAGASEVHAAVVHAVMATGALEQMFAAGVRRLAVTDSVGPISDPRLENVPTAALLATALA